VKFQDTVIPQSAQAQYLGLILDKRLTWRQHITKITATCRAKLRKLNWMLKGTSELSFSNKMLLYRSIVVPSLTYCIQIWGTASDSNVMRVQRVQKRAYDCGCAFVRKERCPSLRSSHPNGARADKHALKQLQRPSTSPHQPSSSIPGKPNYNEKKTKGKAPR